MAKVWRRRDTPNYSSMEGYVAAKVFTEGLKRAGRTRAASELMCGLESVSNTNIGGFHAELRRTRPVASHFVEAVDADRGRQSGAVLSPQAALLPSAALHACPGRRPGIVLASLLFYPWSFT